MPAFFLWEIAMADEVQNDPQEPAPDEEGDGASVLHYGTSRTQQWVAIAQFSQAWEAHLACNKLEDGGIRAQVREDTFALVYGHKAVGAKLMVWSDDVGAAVGLLAQTPARSKLLVRPAEAVEPVKCPRCGSEKVFSRDGAVWIVRVLTRLWFGRPTRRRLWTCAECGNQWITLVAHETEADQSAENKEDDE